MLTLAPGSAELVIVKLVEIGGGGLTVTVAAALVEDSMPISEPLRFAELVAVIVTRVEFVTRGAVNMPVLEIVPALADQIKGALEFPIRWAVN